MYSRVICQKNHNLSTILDSGTAAIRAVERRVQRFLGGKKYIAEYRALAPLAAGARGPRAQLAAGQRTEKQVPHSGPQTWPVHFSVKSPPSDRAAERATASPRPVPVML